MDLFIQVTTFKREYAREHSDVGYNSMQICVGVFFRLYALLTLQISCTAHMGNMNVACHCSDS